MSVNYDIAASLTQGATNISHVYVEDQQFGRFIRDGSGNYVRPEKQVAIAVPKNIRIRANISGNFGNNWTYTLIFTPSAGGAPKTYSKTGTIPAGLTYRLDDSSFTLP